MEGEEYDSDGVYIEEHSTEDEGDGDSVRRSRATSDSSLSSSAPTSGDEGSASTARVPQVTFDSALPIKHSYLGDDLEEVSGRTLLEEGSVHALPIFIHSGLVLVPGQTLPLMVLHPGTIDMLRSSVSRDKTFGVVCMSRTRRADGRLEPAMEAVGTTAEIYAWHENAAEFKVKARGRQRFQVLEIVKRGAPLVASVRILREAVLSPYVATRRRGKTRRHSTLAEMTVWPGWVYDMYDAQRLADALRVQLDALITPNERLHIPTDPVQLSYWSMQNLPLVETQRIALLMMDSAVQRLRFQLDFIQKCQMLVCARCRHPIADPRHVFSMSAEGPQGTYVNPGGFVHETMTLHRAPGVTVRPERPSYEYSWFPGYGWTMVECTCCGKHMGWLFTTKKSSLQPKSFFGLCRASLTVKIVKQPEEEEGNQSGAQRQQSPLDMWIELVQG